MTAAPLRQDAPVFIGPVCVGKTTVSQLVSEALGLPRVELDEIAMQYYRETPEFIPDEYNRLQEVEGFVASYRYFEPALAFAVERVVADHPRSVLDLGAGHTCYLDRLHFSRVQRALSPYKNVVLLLPDRQPDRAIQIIRDRCQVDRNMSWAFPEVDFIVHWVVSDQNGELATHVVFTGDDTPAEVARRIVALVA